MNVIPERVGMWSWMPVFMVILCFSSFNDLDTCQHRNIIQLVSLNDIELSPDIKAKKKRIISDEEWKSSVQWNLTIGGSQHRNWYVNPLAENSLNSIADISSAIAFSDANTQFNGSIAYKAGVLFARSSNFKKTNDNLSFKVHYAIRNTPFNLIISGSGQSQLFPTFTILPNDSTNSLNKLLFSSFISPASFLFSYGYSYSFSDKGNSNIEFGVCGGKSTLFWNQRIYDELQKEELFGVKKGAFVKTEYGLNIKVAIRKPFTDYFTWENRSVFFICDDDLLRDQWYKSADIEIRNIVFLFSGKVIKTRIENCIQFDRDMGDKFQFKNLITIGLGNLYDN